MYGLNDKIDFLSCRENKINKFAKYMRGYCYLKYK